MRKEPERTAEPVGPALIVTYGNTSRRQRPLDRDVFMIGRGSGCDLSLVAPEVAPVHCLLVRTAAGWRLRDCSGRSGTLLNGQKVQETALADDDNLQVGSFTFRVRLPAPSAADVVRLYDSDRRTPPPDALADLERQGEALRKARADLDERLRQVEQDERELADRRTALERDENALQQLRVQLEREARRPHEEAEARRQALEEEGRRAAERAAALAEEAARLERRGAELECFARHLRQLRQEPAWDVEQVAELVRLREEVEELRTARAARPDTVPDMPSPVRAAELAGEAARAREAAALFQGELAALATELNESHVKLQEEINSAAALRKQADIALANEDEMRRRVERLERDLRDRDNLIERLQARNQANPWDTQALSAVEMEMNRFRLELDRDRRELEEGLRQLRQGQEELHQARRDAELEMSRERAQVARDRVELSRLRDQIRCEQERVAREAGSRARLAPRRFKEELLKRGEAGA